MSALSDARRLKPSLRRQLLKWFDAHQRDLPWRNAGSAYGVWVSEVMLQQTQVDRVIGYWNRFMTRFPTVATLAQAELPEVLSLWSGLGYYSRARNLHRAAQTVVAEFGGALPADVEQLRSLPGFGRYTAGAVASIAFGQQTPLVDGNVARVLARLLELEGHPGDKKREQLLWEVAALWVMGLRPGDWNQALMELGATVCIPKSPRCDACPVQSCCGALRNRTVDKLPWPKRAVARRRLEVAVAVAEFDGHFLLGRRPERGLFGGLWELPSANLTPEQSAVIALQELLGPHAAIGPEQQTVERTLTHRELVLRLHRAEFKNRRHAPAPAHYVEWAWVARPQLPELGMSSAMRAALTAIA